MKRSRLNTYTRLQSRTGLKRGGRLNPVSPKKRTRTGKLGITRLVGPDLEKLREDTYNQFDGRCQLKRDEKCQIRMPLHGSVTRRAHLVHLRGKRNHGDVDNVTLGCYHCHIEVDHTKGVEHVALKIHLAIVSEPIPEHQTTQVICGAEVEDARKAFIWDEGRLPELAQIAQIRGMCSKCKAAFQDHKAEGVEQVYGLVNGKDWRSVEEV